MSMQTKHQVPRLPPPFVIHAVDSLRNGLESLRKKLAPPNVVMLEMATSYFISQTLYAVAKLGIADSLNDGPKTVTELAQASGANESALYRLLRACASIGVFVEQPDGHFALTPLARTLQTGVPNSMRDMVLLNGSPVQWRTWGELYQSVKTGQPVFQDIFGASLFDYFAQNPEASRVFDGAMTNFSELSAAAVVSAYQFDGASKIVDVGGGNGVLLATILQAQPTLKGVLYDLPHVAARAHEILQARAVADRCEITSGNFFESVPSGGEVYIAKNVIHDWDDERGIHILKNCKNAMPASAKLVLVEMVIPSGNGPFFGKFLDLSELLLETGGKERTAEEFRALLSAAGFRLTRVVPTASPLSVIEAIQM